MKKMYGLLIISAIFINCKSMDENAFANFTEAPLFGMIYDSKSLPVAGAELILDDEDIALTDINGRVLFSAVSRGEHLVVINKEGFEEARLILNFSTRDQVLYSTLISFQDILDNLESYLKKDELTEAELFLRRAAGINSKDIRFKYLNIVYLSERGEFEEALNEILVLRKSYPADPYVIMTQAKILFYGFNKKEEAVGLLRAFLTSNINEELEILMQKMESGETND